MRRVGQSRRRDANEGQIVDALEAAGAKVARLSAPGVPDLLVSFRNGARRDLCLLEVKTKAGKATQAQREFEAEGWQVFVVRSPEEALRVIGR